MATVAINKRASHDYDLLEKFEGGLVLTGPEVKSMKAGQVQFKGSFLHVFRGQLWLKNLHVSKYKPAGEQPEYDPGRERKVLIHKRELSRLVGKSVSDRLTLVPLSVYTKGNILKLEFALAKGKKQHDKKEAIKQRTIEREMREEY